MEEAKKFLNDMIDCEISPDIYTYNAQIDSLCNEEKILEAFSLFELMISNGIKPTIVTFSSLIFGLCKSGALKKAVQFLSNIARCCYIQYFTGCSMQGRNDFRGI